MSNQFKTKRPGPDGLCMKGQIYSEEKCSICNEKYSHDEQRRGLFCKNHPQQYALGKFIVRFGRNVSKRAKTYFEADKASDRIGDIYRQILADRKAKAAAGPQSQPSPSTIDPSTAASKVSTASNKKPEQ